MLSNLLYKTKVPNLVQELYKKDKRVNDKLIINSLISMQQSEDWINSRRILRLSRVSYLMKLGKGFMHKLSCLYNLRTNYKDWENLKLPDSLFLSPKILNL